MAIVSLRSRRRLFEVGLAGTLCALTVLVQLTLLNRFSIHGIICSLPLVVIIVWGLVFGSPTPSITAPELRRRSFQEIFIRQLGSGSLSGLLIGLFFAGLYGAIIPVYLIAFPILGWISGYFCLRSLSQGNLLCIPLVFILSIIAEAVITWQLALCHRTGVFEHLSWFILPEALLNSIIAPFIYFPLRRWYDLSAGQQAAYLSDWGEET